MVGSVLRVAVVDGQGASFGAVIIKKMRQAFGEEIEIWALGTNAIATAQMLKAGANRGTSGEGAVCHCVHQVDIIIGSISILICNSFMGECSVRMVEAIGTCRAIKMLLPLTQEPVMVVGQVMEPLPHLIDTLVERLVTPLVKARNLKEPS
jgi:hypothetical protein